MSDAIPRADLTVVDNPERSRFELVRTTPAGPVVLGFLEHHPLPDDASVAVLPHTVIDRRWRGQGLGEVLVQGAMDHVRSTGRTVVPRCWFVVEFLELHPEYADLRAA